MRERELTPRELEIQELIKKFDYCKINLTGHEGLVEGIWAVPISQEDKDRIDNDLAVRCLQPNPCRAHSRHDSYGETVKVRLLNHPVYWTEFSWGDEVTAKTNNDMRPIADIGEQDQKQEKDDTQ